MTELQQWHLSHGGTGTPLAATGCAVASYGNLDEELAWGRTRALVVDRSACARIQISGNDRRDLLQRLTTNDVLKIEEGRGVPTVFTTGKGRIVDRVVVHAASDGDLIIGSAHRAQAIAEWINKYVIREDVSLSDITDSTAMIDVVGPKAAESLHAPLLAFAHLHEMAVIDVQGVQVLAIRTDPVAGLTVRLMVPATLAPVVMEFMLGKGARLGGSDAYNALRLEAGLPLYGPDLNESFTPLEAGLVDTLHFNKGCYVGQEVVARIDTYMKQRRYLIALELEGAPPAAGAQLLLPNGDAGEVTSAASVGGGKSRALGYIKTEDPRVGMEVSVSDGGVARTAVIMNRPAQAPAPKGGEGNQCAVVV